MPRIIPHHLLFDHYLIPYLTSNKDTRVLLKFLKEVKKKSQAKHLGRQDRALQTSFQQFLAEQWEAIKQKAIEIATDSGFDEIECAVQAGLLELHTFEGTDNDETVLEFITDCIAGASGSPRVESRRPEMSQRDEQMIREFVEGVCGAVSDGSTHPLFDEQTGLLVKEQIQEQRITPSESAVGRGKHAGLAGHLLARLPSFDQVSIDEVVDIRRELDKPLTRFRGTVIKFSEQIRSASWDEDFAPDAETVFHRDVKPAVLEIEEAVKSNRYLASLLRKLVDKPPVLPAGSAIALVLSNISSLPLLAFGHWHIRLNNCIGLVQYILFAPRHRC